MPMHWAALAHQFPWIFNPDDGADLDDLDLRLLELAWTLAAGAALRLVFNAVSQLPRRLDQVCAWLEAQGVDDARLLDPPTPNK